ncbi:TPA: hypothetical protein RFT58_001273 [Klebsiella pneumoniae subsp. pneumoniae]|uniref:hypothetical protein n=1 Tax=Klebsiella pneumoniae TaxID=573 RepID=UPI0006680247|nr:hypothetical protein [Klebsiella pneumoniae]HDU4554223.1 hypothetical protein [Klebsiella pneumoniae subsp. pneumoniae]ELA2161927.1 hypothetical protein [Klebsiella pneumoniae]MCJ4932297.1 hypothetical protein [Klebsiella pneumoniae]MCM6159780.1 hypothetical protein [Klebsiella pneumoniae]MDU1896803.1 hypothetical protein [Klebsiella pneumoniae]
MNNEISIKDLISSIKKKGLLQSIPQLEQIYQFAIEVEKKLAESEAKCVQLAAENVALKSYRDTLDEIKSSLVGGGHGHMAKADMQAQSALLDVIFDAFDDIKAPGTDAYLAGIKADGVEEFIGRLQQHVDEGDFVGDEVAVIVGAIDCGKEFCEQLREGADK